MERGREENVIIFVVIVIVDVTFYFTKVLVTHFI